MQTYDNYRCVTHRLLCGSLSHGCITQDKTHPFRQGMPAPWVLTITGATHRIGGPRRSTYWNFRDIEMVGRQLSDSVCARDVRKN